MSGDDEHVIMLQSLAAEAYEQAEDCAEMGYTYAHPVIQREAAALYRAARDAYAAERARAGCPRCGAMDLFAAFKAIAAIAARATQLRHQTRPGRQSDERL